MSAIEAVKSRRRATAQQAEAAQKSNMDDNLDRHTKIGSLVTNKMLTALENKWQKKFEGAMSRVHKVEGEIANIKAENTKLEEKVTRLEEKVTKFGESFTRLKEKIIRLEEKVQHQSDSIHVKSLTGPAEVHLNLVVAKSGAEGPPGAENGSQDQVSDDEDD